MQRRDWSHRIEQLDPATDYHEIYRIMVAHEFPWDMNQSLSFALFRTYAVPSIGRLLARTGELTQRVQKRYEDTGLILDAILEHGFGSDPARDAFRRMNQMHGAYEISNEDMRYVLCTFVATPMRWIDAYGWRRFTETEKVASANYYRALGRNLNIRDIPTTWQDFTTELNEFEAARFGFDPGARTVADSTLDLMATFPPNDKLPAALVRRMSCALMDDHLLDAFHYRHPSSALRAAVRTGLKARGRVVRWLPPRVEPRYVRQMPTIRGYPDGYQVAKLGTFPNGCPAGPREVRR